MAPRQPVGDRPLAGPARSLRTGDGSWKSSGRFRGYTLFEVIIVLALLTALAGLVLPGLLSRVVGSTEEAVATRLTAAAAVCRADAQRRGLAMELVAREVEGHTSIVSRLPATSESSVPGAGEVLLEFPPGYSVTTSSAASGGEEAEPADATGVVLTLFLPDGSTGTPGTSFLRHGPGIREIRIARWTGELSLAELPAEVIEPDETRGVDEPAPSLGEDVAPTDPDDASVAADDEGTR
jgi:prepilin-type N-terminal cleavage/methylation domain-containing protein